MTQPNSGVVRALTLCGRCYGASTNEPDKWRAGFPAGWWAPEPPMGRNVPAGGDQGPVDLYEPQRCTGALRPRQKEPEGRRYVSEEWSSASIPTPCTTADQ